MELMLSGIEGASSRPVRRILLRDASFAARIGGKLHYRNAAHRKQSEPGGAPAGADIGGNA